MSNVGKPPINQQKIIDNLTLEIGGLTLENKILREKISLLLKKYFGGKKSEKFDPNQLLFEDIVGASLNKSDSETEENPSPEPAKKPPKKRKKKSSSPRLPANLLTEEIIIDPEEVKANPENYRFIGEERTEELDVITQKFFKRVYVRRKYVPIDSPYCPPIIAPLLPRLIEGSIASPGLLSEIILSKYADHLPLYRQEKIYLERYGIHLSRKTMSDWIDKVSTWLNPIYQIMSKEVTESGYLQVDETPVKYLGQKGSKLGYFWIYRDPGGNVIYEWKASRAHDCLDRVLGDYQGLIHCDGYSAYKCFVKKHPKIILLICFAHARRKFHEALESYPHAASWFLNQIRQLYGIEKRLRVQKLGPNLREAIRKSESQMILKRIRKALNIYLIKTKPKESLGKAVRYALKYWEGLERYVDHGKAEIDNNLVENAVRPTALGKKNWMFIGCKEAGQKSAILYSILASCRSYQINIQEYLIDVLSKLPSMKISEVKALTPKNWAESKKIIAA